MTVPMADDAPEETNFIVGESLHDFLRLGCVHGFFDLEKLAYTWRTELFDEYSQHATSDDEPIFEAFRSEFGLAPWPDIESRLLELNKSLGPKLRFQNR
jgi:hypothetical protein